jgi:hypothetical protein
VCGFESKAIPTHGVIENVEVCLKEYPEKVIHMDIVVVDVPDVWGMLLSRKFASMLGGTLEMDLTYVNIPLKDGTIGRLPNVPVTTTHVQEASDSIKDDKAHDEIIQTLHKYSPKDMPFATEEDFDQIQWPKKEEYQQLLDKYKDKEVGTVKILKKEKMMYRFILPSRKSLQQNPTLLPLHNTPGLFKEQPNTRSEVQGRGHSMDVGYPERESQLMSKEALNHGSDLSKLEEIS